VTYRVLTLGDPRRTFVRPIDGWEFHTVPPQIGPASLAQWAPHRGIANSKLAAYIATLRPDFVVIICEGCVESRLNRFGLVPGPRYVTWSTDSYRHTVRCSVSDLHLSAIPDEAMTAADHFLPLFAGPYTLVPLERRRIRCGIACSPYGFADRSREREIERIRAVLPELVREHGLSEAEYDTRIVDFRFGLNLAVYPDALPNFRSFELGRAGVMPLCSAAQRPLLERLFATHVRLFAAPEDIAALLEQHYDAAALQAFYDRHHSYEARLRELFARFFGLRL